MSYRFSSAVLLLAGFLMVFSSAASAQSANTPPAVDTSRPHALPYYPAQAKSAGKTGTVIVAIHVNELGRPFDVRVDKSSGDKQLDDVSVFAVKHWHFKPATAYGEDVADWTAVGFTFGPDGVKQIDVPPDTKIAREYRNKVICKVLANATGTIVSDGPTCLPRWQWEARAREYNVKMWNQLPHPAMGGAAGSGK